MGTISIFAPWSRTAMKIEIVSSFLVHEGKEVEITVETSEIYKMNTYRLTLSRESWERLGFSDGEISREDMKEILREEEKYRATKKALDILAFGRNSARTLALKLRHRNFSPAVADEVVELLVEKGYINEDEDVVREAELCVRKYWGMRRILMHLHQKGYDNAAINVAKEYLAEVDFAELCADLIRKEFGTLPKDEQERNRVIASVVRYGYSMTEIKNAAKLIERVVLD